MIIAIAVLIIFFLLYWLMRPETYRVENSRTQDVTPIIPSDLPTGQTVFVGRPAGDLDRMELFYRSAGNPQNPVVILIHGISGNSGTTWYNTYADLSAEFYVIGLDLRGHGLTAQPPGEYSISIMAEDVIAFMDTMGIDEAYIAAHSMGGLVAMEVAHLYPDIVSALVLLDTTASWNQGAYAYGLPLYPYVVRIKNRTVGWEQENRDRASAFTQYEVDPMYHEWIYQQRDINQIEPFLSAWNSIASYSAIEFLPNLDIPTLIIYGEDDDLVPENLRTQLHSLIPNSRMEVISSPARHYPQIQFHELVNPILIDFFNDHPREGR